MKSKKRFLNRNRLTAYGFLLPNILGFALFTLFPAVISLVLCFFKWDGQNPMQFVGLGNFAKLLIDTTFKITLKNTLVYTLSTVTLSVTVALLLAVLLNRKMRGIGFLRAIPFIPYISSIIAVAAVWQFLMHPNLGPINISLMRLGIESPPRWFSDTKWAMASVVIFSVWRGSGYYMIILLAGLQGIPQTMYEAAQVDGANGRQKFFNITIPMLSPTLFFVLIIAVINSFKVFNTIYALTQGGPGRATSVLVYEIYLQGFKYFRFGYASAQAFVLFILILIFTLIQFRIQNKKDDYSFS